MKKLLLLLTLTSSVAFSQNMQFEWAKSIGSTGIDQGRIIKSDALGNIYVAGLFTGTVDFDPGTGVESITSAGDVDFFVAKYDPSGNFLWVANDGNIYDDLIVDLVIDNAGNVFITGYGELSSSGAETAMFIGKLDANGNTLWAWTLSSSDFKLSGSALALDTTGNVHVGGYFYGTVDFDPGTGVSELTSTSQGSSDAFILKLTTDGNFIWVKQFSVFAGNAGIGNLAVDAAGNVYSTGDYWNASIDLDPGAGVVSGSNAGGADIFVSKLDSNGDYVWGKVIGDGLHDYGYFIAVDASQQVYLTGFFGGTVDMDPSVGVSELTSAGNRDGYIAKFDDNGDFVWARGFGSIDNDAGARLVLDDTGNIYTTGYFTGTVDFASGAPTQTVTSNGDKDIFVSKMNSNGDYEWVYGIGGTNAETGNSIDVNSTGDIFITGSYSDTVDFDFGSGTSNLTSSGSSDVFFTKWSPNSAGMEDVEISESLGLYPNPTTGELHIVNGEGIMTILDLTGKVVLQSELLSDKIDVSSLVKGVYLLQLRTDNGIVSTRFVKE